LRGVEIDHDAAGMLQLKIGLVDAAAHGGAEIGVLDVADDSDDGGVEFDIVAATLGDGAADGVLRRAEELLGEGQIDDRDFGLPVHVGMR
jgi:hypothetical protein